MKKQLLSVFSLMLGLLIAPLSAEITLLSPCEGVWANRQMLVIDNSEGGDFFY